MDKFLSIFKPIELTDTIKKLAKKQLVEQMWMADGFELTATSVEALEYFLRDEEQFRKHEKSFLIFAQATHSGSLYAFYKKTGATNCEEWPIIVLGDEGGTVVLAKNIFGAMRFWTLNRVQAYVALDGQSFDLFIDNDEIIPSNQAYKNWIKQEFGLEAISSIEQAEQEILQPAISKYQKTLNQIFEQ